MTDTLTYTANADGTISIVVDGKTIKYAKNEDLLTVKGSLERAETKLSKLETDMNTKLADANTAKDEAHQKMLQEQTAREAAESSAKESGTLKEQVTDLTAKLEEANKNVTGVTEKLTTRVRSILTEGFKVDADKIKDMDLGGLEQTESALILTGAKPAPANYDGKGGGGSGDNGNLEGKSPLALATMGYENSNKK
jgi:hypothetical protein